MKSQIHLHLLAFLLVLLIGTGILLAVVLAGFFPKTTLSLLVYSVVHYITYTILSEREEYIRIERKMRL